MSQYKLLLFIVIVIKCIKRKILLVRPCCSAHVGKQITCPCARTEHNKFGSVCRNSWSGSCLCSTRLNTFYNGAKLMMRVGQVGFHRDWNFMLASVPVMLSRIYSFTETKNRSRSFCNQMPWYYITHSASVHKRTFFWQDSTFLKTWFLCVDVTEITAATIMLLFANHSLPHKSLRSSS